MRIIYTPADGEKQEWIWKPALAPSTEAEALEDVTDWPFPEFLTRFIAGSTRARRALLWVLLRRDHPRLQFDQVRFTMGELGDEYDDDEVAAARAALDEQDRNTEDPLDDAARQRLAEVLAGEAGVEPGNFTGAGDAPGTGT